MGDILRLSGKRAMSKVFVLGVGAQKAGTTWLSEYLREQPGANFGFRKEYHTFDQIHLRKSGNRLTILVKRCLKNSGKIEVNYRSNFLVNPDSYFAYFNDLLQSDQCTLTGDITPQYATLPKEILAEIKREFARRLIEVKPIFLMRDPVYRLQSRVRMNRSNGRITGSKWSKRLELDWMREWQLDDSDRLRASYDKTLARLFDVFGRDGCYVDIYETMFDDAGDAIAARLGRFLGMELSPAPVDRTVRGASQTDHALTCDEYMSFRAGYAEMIAAVEKTGFAEVGDLWQWREAG